MTWQGNLKVPESKKTCSCRLCGAADNLCLGEAPETVPFTLRSWKTQSSS